jgi:Undecaprenyl-phosphate galactose phosphotransferase WbaP
MRNILKTLMDYYGPIPAGIEPDGSRFYHRRLLHNTFWMVWSDTMVLLFSIVLSGYLRYLIKDYMPPSRGFWIIPTWWIGAAAIRLLPGWGNGPVEELRRIQMLLLAVFAMAAAVLFLSKTADVTSRIKFLLMYVVSAPSLPLMRALTRRLLVRKEEWGVPVVVYGNDETASHVISVLQKERGLGYQPVGIFDQDEPAGSKIMGVPVLGGLNDATKSAAVALLAAPVIPREQLASLLESSLAGYRKVIIIPDLLDIPSLWVQARDFMGVLGLEVTRNLLSPIALLGKIAAEVGLVLLLSPLWAPLGLLLTLFVWIEDRHNPIYAQERVGRHGKRFRAFKFRTMVPDAERALQAMIEQDPEVEAEWKRNSKLRNDPRITRAGRFLRRTSLDELPQLLNVLKGEMSLVGPRPLPAYHHDKLPERVRSLREQVLPGITGLWQVSGRSEAGDAGMERWDAYYVRNWSPWLDIVILVRTFRAVWTGRGAY